MTTTLAPLFFEVIQTALPEGVLLNIKPHSDEDDKLRYIPDLTLNELKAQLVDLGGPTVEKKKKRK